MTAPPINTPEWKRTRRLFARFLPAPCGRCGQVINPGDDWHLGHRVARSQGGTNDLSNLRPEHARCNLAEAATGMGGDETTPASCRRPGQHGSEVG
jgi:5-methylcytosine-specific restriction endonuclease McrA